MHRARIQSQVRVAVKLCSFCNKVDLWDLVDRNIVSSLLAIYPITYSALLEVGVQLTIYLIGLG